MMLKLTVEAQMLWFCLISAIYNYICTIVASRIKGTAREIYRIFPCDGDFPCIPTWWVYRENPCIHPSLQVKPLRVT